MYDKENMVIIVWKKCRKCQTLGILLKHFLHRKTDDKYVYNAMHGVAITWSVSKQDDV